MTPAIGNAAQGIQLGNQQIERSAAQIASAENMQGMSDMRNLTEALVGMKNGEIQAKAAIKVLNAAGEMLGEFFDEQA
jgi:hypothetical protein